MRGRECISTAHNMSHAARTKQHRLSGLSNRNTFLIAPYAEKSHIKVPVRCQESKDPGESSLPG